MSPKKPNIIFIQSDQHNAKVLGYKGHPNVKTPALDRMANEGVSFDNAITQNPICTPSRVSWLSGQYCHNHGYYGLAGANPNGLPTFLGHFREAGYRTAAIGKSHCPDSWVEDDCDLFYETSNACSTGRAIEYKIYLEKKGLTALDDCVRLPEFGSAGTQAIDARPSHLKFKDSQEAWGVRRAIEFMEQSLANDTPFMTHLSFSKPHQCYTPAKKFWDLYNKSQLVLPPNADWDMKNKAPHLISEAKHWRERSWQLFEPKTFEAGRLRKLQGYLGNISHMDHAIGKLLTWLDTKELNEETIIIYSSDHGEYACEHGIMEKSPGICSDAVTRIPMIWRWGNKFKHRNVKNIVEAIDLGNTLCALSGIESIETSDGRDISNLLYGEEGDLNRIGFTENIWSKSLRKGKYRFVFYPKDFFKEAYPNGFYELYDLDEDRWEMNNLFFDKKYVPIINDFEKELLNWMITTIRPKTTWPPVAKVTSQAKPYHKKNVTNAYKKNITNADGKVDFKLLYKTNSRNYL